MDRPPFISKRKTDKKPTYTHKKSVSNRLGLLEAYTALGVDINQLESFGTIEQLIKGEDLYRDGAVEVEYMSALPQNFYVTPDKEIAFSGKVRSSSEKKKDYPFSAILDYGYAKEGKFVYVLPRTINMNHECKFTTFEKTKKFMKFPCCKHKVAVACWAIDSFPRILDDQGYDHIEVSSFYTDQQILPVDEDLRDFYDTVKDLKVLERMTKLYEYFTSPEKVFRTP